MEKMDVKSNKKEIDLLDFWRIALKRKWLIVAITTIILLLGGFQTFTSTPLYRAGATILIEDISSNMMSIEDIFRLGYGFRGSYFNTQLKLLRSRSLAERVARRMRISARPEIKEMLVPKKSLIQNAKHFIMKWIIPLGKEPVEDSGFVAEKDPDEGLAYLIQGGLFVDAVAETKMISVNHVFAHPVLAADIVNAVINEFIDFSVEMRYEATRQASEFLTEQISRTREDLAAKEKEMQKYGEEKNLLFLNEKESTVVSKFADLNRVYSAAQIERISKEVAYRELTNIDIDSMHQHVNNGIISGLKSQYIQAKVDYDLKNKIYQSDYPEMVNIRTKLSSIKTELESEIKEARAAALSELRTVRGKEESLRKVFEEQKLEVSRMNSNSILYNSLRIEVGNKRSLLNSLDAQQNEALVSARLKGLKTSNIKIVDKALVPGAPFSPNKKRNMILALLMGLIFGVGFAFFVDYLDNTVKGPEEVEKLIGLPALGIIPMVSSNNSKNKNSYYSNYRRSYSYEEEDSEEKKKIGEIKDIELINHLSPQLAVSEDYRTVRTSILFSHPDSPPRTIVFTSSFPQEGKTATVTNTAISFAQLEKKVLLIDSDLRKPRLHKVFEARNRIGLSSYLIGLSSLDNAIQETSVDNVWLLPSGPHPPNPAELINSKKMEELMEITKNKFDVVFIDTPPVLAVIDPIIVCSLSDAVVFVLKEGKTSRRPLFKAIEEIRRVKSRILGIVYNEVRLSKKGYYSPYYQNYQSYYYEDGAYESIEDAA